MRSIIGEVRDMLPLRPLSFIESLQVAERQADKLRELAGVESPEFPESVISNLPKITVERVRGCPASGATKRAYGHWVILLNASETLVRQRFSLVHEFKHVLDGGLTTVLYQPLEGLSAEDWVELVCDYFASCLLMPRGRVRKVWDEERRSLERRLARRFQVSSKAMSFRLMQIGLVDHRDERWLTPAQQEAWFDGHDVVPS